MKNEERKIKNEAHRCECARCSREGEEATRELHAHLNLFLSTLDWEKRLMFLGLESMNSGYGGDVELERITGVKAGTIAKTRWTLQEARLNGRYLYEHDFFRLMKIKECPRPLTSRW